ncbi:MAG: hypothetical protein QOK29_2465 [Rhodospirillaceae bacterium]|jgi:hypothetical protein|nr:hypothetical protein [Rhodospirillaceae bacterium]
MTNNSKTQIVIVGGGDGLFVFPHMLLYTGISYGVFSGKLRSTSHH